MQKKQCHRFRVLYLFSRIGTKISFGLPNRERDGQQSVKPCEHHGDLGQVAGQIDQREKHGKTGAVGDEFDAAEEYHGAHMEAGIHWDGPEALQRDQNVADAVQ
jgi:diadenosine tetraphosphatase ApaH/serine/threonine PP2A family protein phosphatase